MQKTMILLEVTCAAYERGIIDQVLLKIHFISQWKIKTQSRKESYPLIEILMKEIVLEGT